MKSLKEILVALNENCCCFFLFRKTKKKKNANSKQKTAICKMLKKWRRIKEYDPEFENTIFSGLNSVIKNKKSEEFIC